MTTPYPNSLSRLVAAVAAPARLPVLFVVYGLIAVIAIAWVTPPFQVSDEIAHFQRADQVRRGSLVGTRQGPASGGIVDQGIARLADIFGKLILKPDNKATDEMFARASSVRWGQGLAFAPFENTSIYPPFFYGPAALAIAAGEQAGLSVVTTLYAARLVNGVLAVAVGTLAIRLAGSQGLWVFAVVVLPMSLSQMASVSQDALLIPTAALAAGLLLKLLRDESPQSLLFALFVGTLMLLASGRVAYTGLALLPLIPRQIQWTWRLGGAAAIVAAAGIWSWIAAKFALVQFGLAGANSAGQIQYLLARPWKVLPLAINTVRYQTAFYAESFIGRLGWLDASLPVAYHAIAWSALLLAALAVTGPLQIEARLRQSGLTVLAIVASAATLFGALYVTWTPVGNFIVDGGQGRYFLPLAFFLPVLLASARPHRHAALRSGATLASVAVFTLITLPVVIWALMGRYYWS